VHRPSLHGSFSYLARSLVGQVQVVGLDTHRDFIFAECGLLIGAHLAHWPRGGCLLLVLLLVASLLVVIVRLVRPRRRSQASSLKSSSRQRCTSRTFLVTDLWCWIAIS